MDLTCIKAVLKEHTRQMARWLARPLLIDQQSCNFELPNLRLEESTLEEGMPSPFAHIALETQLFLDLSRSYTHLGTDMLPDEIGRLHKDVDGWLASLSSVHRVFEPDRSWDNEHMYIPMQRRQLHATAYMIKLGPLKQYLTKKKWSPKSNTGEDIRAVGVDVALMLLEVTQELSESPFTICGKFHFFIFCLFDTSAILCSAIAYDQNSGPSLPKRMEILEALSRSLQVLKGLAASSKTAALSYKLLMKIVNALPSESSTSILNSRDRKRLKASVVSPAASSLNFSENSGSGDIKTQFSITRSNSAFDMSAIAPPTAVSPALLSNTAASLQSPEVTVDIQSKLDPFTSTLFQASVENINSGSFGDHSRLSEMDLTGLDPDWDWNDLDIDFNFLNPGSGSGAP
jgi:hypothetical protein